MERLNAPETPLCLCSLWEWQQSTGVFVDMSIFMCTPAHCIKKDCALAAVMVVAMLEGRQARSKQPV